MNKIVELRPPSKEIVGIALTIWPCLGYMEETTDKEIDITIQISLDGKKAPETIRTKRIISIDEFTNMLDRYFDIIKEEIRVVMGK